MRCLRTLRESKTLLTTRGFPIADSLTCAIKQTNYTAVVCVLALVRESMESVSGQQHLTSLNKKLMSVTYLPYQQSLKVCLKENSKYYRLD